MFYLHNKKEQTYEEALHAMTEEAQFYELKFISKRHWTEELLCAAMKHSCGRLGEVPVEMRTLPVCTAAVQSWKYGATNVNDIPCKLLTFEFARDIVSRWPNTIDTILYEFRQNRWQEPYTEEDIALMAEASCPTKTGEEELVSTTLDRASILEKCSFERFCSEEYGKLSSAKTSMFVMNFALNYLLANWDDAESFLKEAFNAKD